MYVEQKLYEIKFTSKIIMRGDRTVEESIIEIQREGHPRREKSRVQSIRNDITDVTR